IESSPTFRLPGGLRSGSPCSFRRRGAHRIAEAAILARCLPAVTGRTQRLPPGPVPEHRFIAAVRIDVVDDAGRLDQIMARAFHAQRMIVQERGAFRSPALRAVERTRHRIALAGIVTIALALLAPANRAMDRRADGHDAGLDDGEDGNGDDTGNDKAREGSFPSRARLSRA